jgi:hypothetical protein
MSIFDPNETAAQHASRKAAAISSPTSANADRSPVALTPGMGLQAGIEIPQAPPIRPIGLPPEEVRPIGI